MRLPQNIDASQEDVTMPMNSNRPSLSLGDLVSAAMEQARAVTPDDHTAAQLASRTVARWLARSGRQDIAKRLTSNAKS